MKTIDQRNRFNKMSFPHVISVMLILLLSGCASSSQTQEQQSALTPGMTKKSIEKGKTTQAEVMQIFGPPDYVTSHSSGGEMWGYDRVSRETASTVFGGAAIGGGIAGPAGALGGLFGSTKNTSQTVRTLFLLVYFDEKDTVTDYKISATRF